MSSSLFILIQWGVFVGLIVCMSACLLWPPRAGAADQNTSGSVREADFKVKETGNKIEISSPWGQKNYETDFTLGAMKHYRIEIPLEDLRPPLSPMANAPATPGRELASTQAQTASGACELPKTIEFKSADSDPRKPASIPDTPSEYDSTDRLLLEANHLYNLGKFYEASIYVEELIRKNPALVRAWVMKGSLLYVQGYTDLAKKAWAKAGELDPQDPQVKDIQKRYP